MTSNNKKELIKKALGIIWWACTLLLAAILINIIAAKFTGKVPRVFGYSIINIVSGSMEDEIPQDSYILIKKIDASEVKRDNIICFYSTDPTIYGMPNTHRVVEDPIKTDTGYEYVTRGDANFINDKVNARGDRLIGVYVKNLDGLTAFTKFISDKSFLVIVIGLQVAVIAMVAYSLIVKRQGGEDEETVESKKD